jgi:hypothetical protein
MARLLIVLNPIDLLNRIHQVFLGLPQDTPQQVFSEFAPTLQHPASVVQHLLSLPQQPASFLQQSLSEHDLQQLSSALQHFASITQQAAAALILQPRASAAALPDAYAYPASPSANTRTIVFTVFISVSPVIRSSSVDRQDRRP